MSEGRKNDSEKIPVDLVPSEAIFRIGEVLAFGAKKYDRHNWRKGISYSRLIAAAQRHILAFNAGENLDPESNLSHVAHAACCLLFLLEFDAKRPDLDDRYKGEK